MGQQSACTGRRYLDTAETAILVELYDQPCHQPTRAHDVCRKGLGKNISLVRTDLMATHRYPATKTNTCNHPQMLQVAAISFKYHEYQHF